MDLGIDTSASRRSRLPSLHLRSLSAVTNDSDSTVSSPDGRDDEEHDYFTQQSNDSQSSLGGVPTIREMSSSIDLEREHRVTPISKLPPELLISIFTKLTTTSDLRNCMLVSYYWALHTVGILWHRPLCNKWQNLINVVAALADRDKSFFPYHELVRRLNLSALSDKVNDGTVQAFEHCKRVERLTLTNCSKLTDSGVSRLVEGSRHLQALDVTDLEALTDHTLFVVAENCPKLQGLNITNCQNITDESLVAVSENCRQLKRLKLNNVLQVTDLSVSSVARNCRSILEIDLAGCSFIASESVTALLANLSHLRELRLAYCVRINDSAFLNLAPKLQFDSLRILDLTACEHVHDDAIARIIPAAPRLRNLVLAKCKNITDRAVLSICKLGKNLHYIHLGHCAFLTDAAVINLVKACNRIRYIDLACCARLTDASVRHLAQLPKLRRIGLVKCQNLTDISISALAQGRTIFVDEKGKIDPQAHPSSLERVHLSYCVNLSRTGITALLRNCPRLTHLSLTGVQAFLHEDLTRFCRDAPAEFTHPQRDVFCVFSGDGVHRLRDYLTRMDEEAQRLQEQDAMSERLFEDREGDRSPGAETMSDDDGTVGGSEQHVGGVHLFGGNGIPIVNTPHQSRPRPRSLYDLPSHHPFHVEMPLYDSDVMQRMGPLTPSAPMTPEMRASVEHLNLISSTTNLQQYHPEYDFRSRSPAFDLGPSFDEQPGSSSRNASRRHTLDTSLGLFAPQSAPLYPAYAESHMRQHVPRFFDEEEVRNLPGPSTTLMPPGLPRRSSGQYPGGLLRTGGDYRHPWLRPDASFSAFEANHDAIMSTIPRSRGGSRDPSRSNSPHMSRVSSRNRLSLLNFRHTPPPPPPPPAHYDGPGPSLRRQVSRAEEEHHEAILRQMMADSAEQLRENCDLSPEELEMPFLPPESIVQVPATPITPVTPFPRAMMPNGSQTATDGEDVQMTQ